MRLYSTVTQLSFSLAVSGKHSYNILSRNSLATQPLLPYWLKRNTNSLLLFSCNFSWPGLFLRSFKCSSVWRMKLFTHTLFSCYESSLTSKDNGCSLRCCCAIVNTQNFAAWTVQHQEESSLKSHDLLWLLISIKHVPSVKNELSCPLQTTTIEICRFFLTLTT